MTKRNWWLCNGICQHHAPFNGYAWSVAAPGVTDQWWAVHDTDCGGTFLRIQKSTQKRQATSSVKTENNNVKGKLFNKIFKEFN